MVLIQLEISSENAYILDLIKTKKRFGNRSDALVFLLDQFDEEKINYLIGGEKNE